LGESESKILTLICLVFDITNYYEDIEGTQKYETFRKKNLVGAGRRAPGRAGFYSHPLS
jgi:hypothetical protein